MSFYKRYELARLIQEGEAKTFSAVEIATGRNIVLHLLAPSALLPITAVRDIVARAEHQPKVIEVGEFAGSYYIATEPDDSFQSFRNWVDALPAAPVAVPPPAPPVVRAEPPPRKLPHVRKLTIHPSPPLQLPTGEFTGIFGTPKAKIAGQEDPGEFTQLFYGKAGPKPSAPILEFPGDSTGTGGEFTKFFSGRALNQPVVDEFKPVFDAPLSEPDDAPPAAAADPSPLWPANTEKEERTGEYTKFFGNSLTSEPVDIPAEQAKQAASPEPKEKPFRDASEFTRMFGPEGVAGKAAPAVIPNYPAGSDNTTPSMIFGQAQPVEESPQPAETPFFTSSVDVSSAEADDYSRVVGTRDERGMAPMQQAEAPVHDRKRTGLIIVLVVVGTTLLSLLIWALFARGSK